MRPDGKSHPPRSMNFDQQEDLFSPDLARPVTVLGAGSVGSQVVCQLAQVGCTDITVWDGDDIASHNIPMSVYRIGDLGRWKVEALADLVREKSGITIKPIRRMWNGEALRGSVVCCVHWMDTRADIWKQVRHNPLVDILIDTRIAKEFVAVYAINPTDPEHVVLYESRLYPSSEAVRPTCGEHGIVYVSGLAACAAVARLTSVWKGRKTAPLFEMLGGSLQQI